jgi:hypothetical protein
MILPHALYEMYEFVRIPLVESILEYGKAPAL